MTIYAIGTGHSYLEPFNTLVKLCDDTKADYKILSTTSYKNYQYNDSPQPLEKLKEINLSDYQNKNQVCVLVNGVAKFAGPDEAQLIQNKCILNLISLIEGYNPDILNMVGHSRGAMTCLRIAEDIDSLLWAANLACNVFCIDPVDWTTYKDGKSYTLSSNIRGYKRIAMEDDSSTGSSIDTFPLMTIKSSATYTISSDDNIRLPGTHGTATQCNPILESGKTAYNNPGKPLWPIGYSTYTTINKQLISWGTEFNNISNDFQTINTYANMFINNPATLRGGVYIRTVNDLDPCKPDAEQKTEMYISTRLPEGLDLLCKNIYRGGPLFINNQHHDLFKTHFPKTCAAIPNEYKTIDFHKLSSTQKAADRSSFLAKIGADLGENNSLVVNCPIMLRNLENLL